MNTNYSAKAQIEAVEDSLRTPATPRRQKTHRPEPYRLTPPRIKKLTLVGCEWPHRGDHPSKEGHTHG
jgi:hypothetical protein